MHVKPFIAEKKHTRIKIGTRERGRGRARTHSHSHLRLTYLVYKICRGGSATVNFGHRGLGPSDAFNLFKVDAKQLSNLNVVKQNSIFGAHVKPEK
jgi:hypothetical protein